METFPDPPTRNILSRGYRLPREAYRLIQKVNSLLLSIEVMRKFCTLQWIPLYVDIERNKLAGFLANETKKTEPVPSLLRSLM